MQTTNVIYRAIVATGKYKVEYKAEIAGVTYGQNQIYINYPEETCALFDKFSIGNAVAGSLKISLVPTGVIPAMSRIDMYYRVRSNDTIASSWIPKGKYFIDTRKTNKDGVVTFEAYDSMLKTEYVFMESGSWTSTTAEDVVDMIANDIGVSVDAATTSILQNNPMTVPTVPVIGEDGTTGREMLKAIATMYGGNFIIDEIGNLKLVQLKAPDPAQTASIGKLASSLDIAPAFAAIDRVIIKLDDKTGYKSPDVPDATWDAMTGRILEAYCPWTSQAVADAVLDVVEGFVYQPYSAIGATMDPAHQLGDGVIINGTTSMIFKEVLHLDLRCAADLSAPFDEEVNHEYPYRSAAQRKISDSVTQEQLATAGQTIINGGNIMTDTIVTEGTYPSGVVGETRLEAGTVHSTGSQGSDQYNGVFEASNIYLNWTDGSDTMESWIEAGWIELKKKISGVQEVASMPVVPEGAYVPVTRSSGLTVNTATFKKWGRMAQLTITFNAGSTAYNAGDTIFSGSIPSHFPVANVMGCGYYLGGSYSGMINANGNITVRATSYLGFSGGDVTISFTYLF